jgi:hypothetical protein
MLATWRRTIAKCSRAFTTIAKQAMPFGDHLSLKSESDFSNILSLNLCWRLGEQQSLSVREHFIISLNIDWRFGDLLSLKQKR